MTTRTDRRVGREYRKARRAGLPLAMCELSASFRRTTERYFDLLDASDQAARAFRRLNHRPSLIHHGRKNPR